MFEHGALLNGSVVLYRGRRKASYRYLPFLGDRSNSNLSARNEQTNKIKPQQNEGVFFFERQRPKRTVYN